MNYINLFTFELYLSIFLHFNSSAHSSYFSIHLFPFSTPLSLSLYLHIIKSGIIFISHIVLSLSSAILTTLIFLFIIVLFQLWKMTSWNVVRRRSFLSWALILGFVDFDGVCIGCYWLVSLGMRNVYLFLSRWSSVVYL